MKTVLKLEEAAIFFFCIVLFSRLDFAWWWFPALVLIPDLSMLGYLINTKIGAFSYNLLHHRLTAVIIAIYAIYSGKRILATHRDSSICSYIYGPEFRLRLKIRRQFP